MAYIIFLLPPLVLSHCITRYKICRLRTGSWLVALQQWFPYTFSPVRTLWYRSSMLLACRWSIPTSLNYAKLMHFFIPFHSTSMCISAIESIRYFTSIEVKLQSRCILPPNPAPTFARWLTFTTLHPKKAQIEIYITNHASKRAVSVCIPHNIPYTQPEWHF